MKKIGISLMVVLGIYIAAVRGVDDSLATLTTLQHNLNQAVNDREVSKVKSLLDTYKQYDLRRALTEGLIAPNSNVRKKTNVASVFPNLLEDISKEYREALSNLIALIANQEDNQAVIDDRYQKFQNIRAIYEALGSTYESLVLQSMPGNSDVENIKEGKEEKTKTENIS